MQLSFKEYFELGGDWLELCEIKGYNEWIFNEGLADEDDTFYLTNEEAKQLKIVK